MGRYIFLPLIILFSFKTGAQTPVLSLADSLLAHGKYLSALDALQKEPQTYPVLVKQADIYRQTGNYSRAVEYYQKALRKKPSEKLYRLLAKSWLAKGDAGKTIRIYEDLLQKDSLNLLVKYDLARLYAKSYRKDEAIKLLEQLHRADPNNPNYPYELGKLYQNKGSKGFLKSGNLFLSAYRADTTHLRAIYELAKFFKQLRFKDSTRLFVDRGLRIDPKSINFNQLKVKMLMRDQKYDSTLVYLKRLEDAGFKTKFTYTYYGLAYQKLRDLNQAETYLKKARNLDWQDAMVLYYLGLVEKEQGKLRAAEMDFLMSLGALKQKTDKQYYELGMIELEKKDPKKAMMYFEKSYRNNTKNHLALFQWATTADRFYKDKKRGYDLYKSYVENFRDRDKELTAFCEQRIREIRKEWFKEGKTVE